MLQREQNTVNLMFSGKNNMDVFETIKNRRSVRGYKPNPVPDEKLEKILESARLAPSAYNAQDWRFIVIKDLKIREKLARAVNKDFIAQAPIVIAGVSLDPQRIMPSEVPNYAVDLAIAVDHMTLVATREGLGTCWIGAFPQEDVKKILEIPKKYKVVALISLGFAADEPRPKIRKSLEEIICYDNF